MDDQPPASGGDVNVGPLHKHCATCFSFTRCVARNNDPDERCDFQPCELGCGAVFHGCKALDHHLVCENARVPCLNAEIGCPVILPRKDRGRHLAKCPASVVVCMAEWNRWPVFSAERRKHIPFKQRNPYASQGQLGKDDHV